MKTLALLFALNSHIYHLPNKLLASVCYIESAYSVKAVHHDDGDSDSLGVCQIKLETARWLGFKGSRKELMRPSVNIHYAAKYLAHQIKRYHGSMSKGLVAYNQGSAKHLTHTRYSDKIMKLWEGIR